MDASDPQFRGSQQRDLSGGFDKLTDALVQRLGDNLRTIFDVGDRLQSEIIDASFDLVGTMARSVTPVGGGPQQALLPIFEAKSRAGEEVIISYTRGQGRFSDAKRFISLNNKIYLLDGREFGIHQGVWERLFESPGELLGRPSQPSPPLNEPVGPVERGQIAAATKAIWAFLDGEIFSVGPAASHLIPLSDGSFLFLVSTAQLITHGTGRFEGAFGCTQSLGATLVPRGVDLFGRENVPFPATTIDTFKLRVVRTAQLVGAPRGRFDGSRARAGTFAQPEATGLTPAPFTGSPDSKFVEVCGSKMHYVDLGHGDPILFLHGNPTWSYLWRNILPDVAGATRCLAPDLIGMGNSDSPDIEYRFFDHVKYLDAFIDKLGLKNVTLVVHDWGCILGFFYAMRHEANVRGLVFMEALLRPYRRWQDFPGPLRATFQAFRTSEVGYEKIVKGNEFIEQLLPASMIRKLTPAEMDMYRRPFQDSKRRKVIWRFANELPIENKPADVSKAVEDYGRWLQRTKVPKLLLYADPGAITTAKDVEWAQRNLSHLTTASLGAGIHFHQEDHPREISREIKRWLQTIA